MIRDEWVSVVVALGIPADVGHGRIRIPFTHVPDARGDCIEPGDTIEISGSGRSTVALAWRARPEDSMMLGLIRIDGIIRKNSRVKVGDKVSIRKVDPKECKQLVLSAVISEQQKVRFGPDIEGFARRGLNKRSCVAGDRIFIPGMTLFAEALPFLIVSSDPEGPVKISQNTEMIFTRESVNEQA